MRKLRFRIALAGGDAGRERFGQRGKMLWRKLYVERAERFCETIAVAGADQRDDVASLRRDPGDRDLRGRGADVLRDRAEFFHQRQVGVEIVARKARAAA